MRTKIINNKPRSLPPVAYLLLAVVMFWSGHWVWDRLGSHDRNGIAERRSSGEKLLVKELDSSEKLEGIKAFRDGNYDSASQHFHASLDRAPNDPEARIYEQNSKAIAKAGDAKKTVKIIVVLPIGSNVNIAQEMLRGVSQVQMEVNQQGGINDKPLLVEIYSDDNDPAIAKAIANYAIQDAQVISVIGSNTSNASLASAPIYQQAGLVMITPTSMTRDLTGIGSYILRTTPTSQALATTLAHQIYTVERHRKVAICFDSKATDSTSFKDELTAEFARLGGEIASFTCDLGAADFKPNEAIAKANNSGADALFVASHIDRLSIAYQVAAANQGKLPLYSSPTLSTNQTLQAGSAVSGLTLVTPWQNALDSQPGSFAERAERLWGGKVSWRTATSYDAGIAIVTGLRQSNGTRQGLQSALHNPQFSAEGATGKVKFLPTGDRVLPPTIAQVREVDGKWAFVPLPLPTTDRVPQLDRSIATPLPRP